MTYQDFLKKFRKINSFDKYWNYFLSFFIIGIGLFFIYDLLFTDNHETQTTENKVPKEYVYLLSCSFIVLGLYGFWRIPKTYQVNRIGSQLGINEKADILALLVTDFQLIELEREEQYRHFMYNGWLGNTFDIYTFFDTENFFFNVQQVDFGGVGGFIDFGTSKRVTRKIRNKILDKLQVI
jgi:hypothetical protein